MNYIFTKKLFNFANIYYTFSKFADLKQNMAIRIMHTLIPSLISEYGNPTKEMQFAAFDIIPGAKEVLQYGIQAINDEYNFSFNEEHKQEIQNTISSGNYIKGLELASQYFLTDFNPLGLEVGGELTGGKNWQTFAKGLIELDSKIKQVEKTGSPQDAMNLSAYLNAIDGMAHNTGSFMEKFVEQEGSPKERVNELLQLRDITRLPAEYAIPLMEQYSRNNPEYRKYFEEYRRLHPAKENEYEEAKKHLTQKEEPVKITPEKKKIPKPPRPK